MFRPRKHGPILKALALQLLIHQWQLSGKCIAGFLASNACLQSIWQGNDIGLSNFKKATNRLHQCVELTHEEATQLFLTAVILCHTKGLQTARRHQQNSMSILDVSGQMCTQRSHALIASSKGVAICAPTTMPWGRRPHTSALRNRQGAHLQCIKLINTFNSWYKTIRILLRWQNQRNY